MNLLGNPLRRVPPPEIARRDDGYHIHLRPNGEPFFVHRHDDDEDDHAHYGYVWEIGRPPYSMSGAKTRTPGEHTPLDDIRAPTSVTEVHLAQEAP